MDKRPASVVFANMSGVLLFLLPGVNTQLLSKPIKQIYCNNTLLQAGLGSMIGKALKPVFKSRKIKEEIKTTEMKPPTVNQQRVVYRYECDLCDADCWLYQSTLTSTR